MLNILRIVAVSLQALLFFTGCRPGEALRVGGQDVFSFGAQEGCHFNRNSYGVRISWKDAVPLTMVIHKSVPERFDSAIISAANRWNAGKGRQLVTVYRDNAWDGSPGGDRKNGIFWNTEWDDDASREQARTSTRYDLSRIIDSDVRINAKHFRFYTDVVATGGNNEIHLESLMVHELGHVLGLQHFSESGVMLPTLRGSFVRTEPSAYELKELGCEY